MNEQIMDCKLSLLDVVNQLEREFLMWRESKEGMFLERVENLLNVALDHAKNLNEVLPEDMEAYQSVFKTFAESVDDCRIMDSRFMTVGPDWACKAKVSPTAFSTINRLIISLEAKSAEIEDNFAFLRQAIQREATGI